jgi:hypothetical protein
MMQSKLEMGIVITAAIVVIVCVGIAAYFAIAEGAGRRGLLQHNVTNTTEICGYITNTTTLEELRDCFRG